MSTTNKITVILDETRPQPYISRKSGNAVYTYKVTGMTPEQIAEYKTKQGQFYLEDKGIPLYQTIKFAGKSAELKKSTNSGNYYIDDSKERMFKSLEDQYGTTIAREKMAETA